MKAPKLSAAVVCRKLSFLTEGYMPSAAWTVDGAFRFDMSLLQLAKFFATSVVVTKITRVSGSPPCLWSLDWFSQRRPLAAQAYLRFLDAYVRPGLAVTLVFDNPFIREEDLQDEYGMFLVEELAKRNTAGLHAVCVASDSLAKALRERFPAMPVYCHMNRLLAEPAGTPRGAELYNQLASQYQRVCLHPEDAVNPAVFGAIAEPARMDVVINDSCLRSCPRRGEHLRILADCRREPYAPMHGRRRLALMNEAGCLRVDAASSLCQKRGGTLTKSECRALYAAGYRSFVIQSQQFRNEATLVWDVLQCMFAPTPELSNKFAVITANAMTQLKLKPRVLSSGLRDFESSSYD